MIKKMLMAFDFFPNQQKEKKNKRESKLPDMLPLLVHWGYEESGKRGLSRKRNSKTVVCVA